MRKVFNVLFSCVIGISVLLANGCGVQSEKDIYYVNGYGVLKKDDGYALMGVEDSVVKDNIFVVPKTIKRKKVVSIGYRQPQWVQGAPEFNINLRFQSNDNINKIIINDDILICAYVFEDLQFLYEVEISSLPTIRSETHTFSTYNLRSLKAKAVRTDALSVWLSGAKNIRNLNLQAENLNGLYLISPENLKAFFVKDTKTIWDDFSQYTNLSVFVIPETVEKIANGTFDNSTVDLYFRVSEEDCPEKIKSSLPTDCNIVWDFQDEIVVFDSFDGSDIVFDGTQKNYQIVTKEGKIQRPEDPTREGCTFEGWYSDYAYSYEWNFEEDVVNENITLVAKWTEINNL